MVDELVDATESMEHAYHEWEATELAFNNKKFILFYILSVLLTILHQHDPVLCHHVIRLCQSIKEERDEAASQHV
jgi:hypothetical protein